LQGLPPCPWCEHGGRRGLATRRALRLISVRLMQHSEKIRRHRLVAGVGP
jgi:hypothetical protein